MSNEFGNPNIILALTTHGKINFFDKGTKGSPTIPTYVPVTFTVPEGMTITRLSIVYPGVANFVGPENIRIFNQQIKTMNNSFNKQMPVSPEQTLKNVVEMAKGLKKLDSTNFEHFDTDDYIGDDGTDQDALNYYYSQDKNYQIRQFTGGQLMINKFHNRLNKDRDESSIGDWSIQMLNVELDRYTDIDTKKTTRSAPDLLTKMRGMAANTRNRDIETTTEEYINFLNNKGVKNVILIDFTCSVFDLFDNKQNFDPSHFVKRFSDREDTESKIVTNGLARQIWDTTDFEKSPPITVKSEKKRGGKTKNKRIKRRNNNTRRKYTRKNRN
jgi:hypothetical protein